MAFSGAGAVALNVVLGKTNAYVKDSNLRSAGAVTLTGTSTSAIIATVAAVSVSVAGGGAAGVGASIGISIARNLIGSKQDGTSAPVQVGAYVERSSIAAGGALTQTATAGQTINAVVLAGSVAVGAGGTAGVGVSGSGVFAENRIAAHVKATIDGDGAGGISATGITLKALDTSTITATAGAASVAASFAGTAAVSVSIGVSLARNEIRNQVDAALQNADGPALTSALTSAAVEPGDRVRVVASGAIYEYKGTASTLNLATEIYTDTTRWTPITTGAVTIEASETATITAISAAASLALGIAGKAGIAVSGAGAEATNVILTRTNAHVDGSILTSTGAVTITAKDTATIRALIAAASVAVGGGTVGVGAAIGVAFARNIIGWDPAGNPGYTHLSSANVLTLNTGAKIKIASGPRTGDVYEYLGATETVAFDFTSSQSPASLATGKRVKVLAGVGGRLADEVYEYVGSATLSSPTLAAQDYSDVTKWRQVTALQQDYSDTTRWKQVNLSSAAAQVQAYVAGSSINAAGALKLTATETATIEALVLAASVALAVGAVGVGLSGAGAAAENRIATDVKAYIDGDGAAGISATSIELKATDFSGIKALVAGASVAAAFGATGVAISIGLAIAFNEVSNDVAAYIKNADTKVEARTGDVVVSASSSGTKIFDLGGLTPAQLDDAATADQDDPSTTGTGNDEAANDLAADSLLLITLDNAFRTAGRELQFGAKHTTGSGTQTLNKGDSVKVAAGYANGGVVGAVYRYTGSSGTSVNLGTQNYATGPWERVLPTVVALADGGSWQVVAGTDVYVITKSGNTLGVSRATIDAVTVAASVALAGGIDSGVAVSGAGAFAQNVVLTKTNAFIEASKVTKAVNVDLDATSTSAISAVVASLSAAVGIGLGSAGVGASIGVSIALNSIGARPGQSAAVPAEVQAYVKGSSIAATGALTIDAKASQSIGAIVVAASVAVGAGAVAGVGFSGAGVFSENRIVTFVKAVIDGDGTTGISAASVALHANDSSAIAAVAGSASVAFALGSAAGVSISIGVALARNRIENQVAAYIANADNEVKSTDTDITLTATEAASIGVVSAAPRSPPDSASPPESAISGAGAEATNVILTKTNTYLSESKLDERPARDTSSSDTAFIDAIVGAVSAAVGADSPRGRLHRRRRRQELHRVPGRRQRWRCGRRRVLLQDQHRRDRGQSSRSRTKSATINAIVGRRLDGDRGRRRRPVGLSGSGVHVENRIAMDVGCLRRRRGSEQVSAPRRSRSALGNTATITAFAARCHLRCSVAGTAAVSLSIGSRWPATSSPPGVRRGQEHHLGVEAREHDRGDQHDRDRQPHDQGHVDRRIRQRRARGVAGISLSAPAPRPRT